jgi:hypothetical protein
MTLLTARLSGPAFGYAFAINDGCRIMDKRLWTGLILAGCSALVLASGQASSAMHQSEASMLVAGTLDIEPDGSVSGYTLEHSNVLPTAITELASKTLPQWRFEPVLKGGKPVKARASMYLQFIGNQVDKTHYAVELRGANFTNSKDDMDEVVSLQQMKTPSYPQDMLDADITGTVYLALHINRQGHVTDAIAEQVNLGRLSSPVVMNQWRASFVRSTLQAAKGWTFNTPTSGRSAKNTDWTVQVPVDFDFNPPSTQEGKWKVYVPGPKHSIPWSYDHDDQSAPEAVANGQAHQVGTGLHLLTPLAAHG